MCGLCGLWHDDPAREVDADLLRRMTATLVHRGPDDEGLHVEGPVGLGFRRLSIIDLAGSHQPMANEDGTCWIVFNGEVYNFQSLRARLADRHTFRTTGDTETVLHAYEERGADCVLDLRGMFAFAIWDRRQRQMLLAVDRFGKKPLYYARVGGTFVFGSELKALLPYPGLSRDLDEAAVVDYLANGFVAAPRTIFRGVYKLPPGHTLTVTAAGLGEPRPYWHPRLATPDEQDRRPEAELAAELRDLLTEAVRLRLISDVPLGAFLSGGIDSSAVVALMSRVSSQPVRTFSMGFDEAGYDEREFSDAVARQWGTQHTHEVVRPDVVSLLPKLTRQFDEPFADNSMIPTFQVSQLARQHVTVALSGDGGDEVFGGYQWYRRAARLARLQSWLPRHLRPLVARLAERLPALGPFREYLLRADQRPTCWRAGDAGFLPEDLQRLLLPRLEGWAAQPESERERRLANVGGQHWLSQLQSLDLSGYLPGGILVKVDRASMLTSLEVRSPLLDQVVFEFMARVPPELKVSQRESKVLLKRAVADLLPPTILNRRKRGFDLPTGAWLRGPLLPLLRDTLLASSAWCGRLFARPELERLVTEHGGGRGDHKGRLWALLCLELWAQNYAAGASNG